MNLARMEKIPSGSIIEIAETKEQYMVYLWAGAKESRYEFQNILQHKESGADNTLKDKWKTAYEVKELLIYNVITIISIPSWYLEI